MASLASSGGVLPEWELRPRIRQIGPDVARLAPLLNKLQPEKWIAAGAPEAYRRQWKDCLDAIPQIEAAAAAFAARPLQLSLAVETLVRNLRGETPEKRIDTGATLVTASNLQDREIQDLINPPIGKYLK